MNENINLCELLKGHEGEVFYSPMYGRTRLFEVTNDSKRPIICLIGTLEQTKVTFSKFGQYNYYFTDSECLLFPSKDQRDWNKWAKKQKPKVPKT